MIIPPANLLKSNGHKYQNQSDRLSVGSQYRFPSIFWQCSTLLVAGLTALVMGYSAAPVVAQPRVIAQYGDINNEQNVSAIQAALGRLGYFQGSPTGLFRERTREAVQNFQRANSLPITGVVDNITADAIFNRDRARDGVVVTSLPVNNADTRERFCREQNNLTQICAYVVLIPGDNSQLTEIRQRLVASPYTPLAENMVLEAHPRGLFIRINQYSDRAEAERVANILRNNISPSFRVEYLPTVRLAPTRG